LLNLQMRRGPGSSARSRSDSPTSGFIIVCSKSFGQRDRYTISEEQSSEAVESEMGMGIEELTPKAKEEISKATSGIYREGMDTSERKLIAHIHPYNIYTLPGSNILELSMGELELLQRGVEQLEAYGGDTNFNDDEIIAIIS
ncbi:hypothetical protein RUND412_011245, partial [Rhizina undulata]